MKVICINKNNIDEITIGKTYEIISYTQYGDTIHYFIADDDCITFIENIDAIVKVGSKCFVSIEEWRNNQIDSITKL